MTEKPKRFTTNYESEFKKGLVPDPAVTPPINVPKQDNSNSSNSSSSNSGSGGSGSSGSSKK